MANDVWDVEELTKKFEADAAFLRLRSFVPDRPDEPAELILEDRIFFMDVSTQDDIYEGAPVFECNDSPLTFAAVRELTSRKSGITDGEELDAITHQILREFERPGRLAQALSEVQEDHAALYSGSSILSFFRDPTAQPYWAQYAGWGSGYGLVFDFSTPWNYSFGADSPPSPAKPFKVRYATQRPVINLAIGPVETDDAWAELVKALLTKSDQWAHQREARLLRLGLGPGHVAFPADSLRAVILGPSITSENRAKMLDLVSRRPQPILVLQAARSARNYALDLHRIA